MEPKAAHEFLPLPRSGADAAVDKDSALQCPEGSRLWLCELRRGALNPPGFLGEVTPELSPQRPPVALPLPTLMFSLFPVEGSVRAAGTDYERRLVQPALLCLLGVTAPVQVTSASPSSSV